jgi:hypothetical protein
LAKYISIVIVRPAIRIRLIMLPIPKYLRIKKNIIANEITTPLLVFANIRENVNKKAKNKVTKNK